MENPTSYISSTLFKGPAHSSKSFLPRARGRMNCIKKMTTCIIRIKKDLFISAQSILTLTSLRSTDN